MEDTPDQEKSVETTLGFNYTAINPSLEFSGTTYDESEWSNAWLAFTDGEYYHRCRQIMLDSGMGGGDVEMILANFWEYGWIAAKHHHNK
jgi:hypothetical protein